jgi:Tfp pilus assembly PilM family ATPase
MRKNNEEISVLAAGLLPPLEIPTPNESGEPVQVDPIDLPANLKGRYASVAMSGDAAIVKLLSFPGTFDAEAEAKVVDNMGLDDPDQYRIGYKLVSAPSRAESKVLAVAMPESEASMISMLLPVGLPAPYSLELSGLASVTTFLHGPGQKHTGEAVGVIDFGADTTVFVLLNKNVVALIRRFNMGTNAILEKVQKSLGIDKETAQGIIADGAFDISQAVGEVMEPLVKQLVVSRDFVERRENCHVGQIYVSGGLIVSRDSLDEMTSAMAVEISFWNPFDGLTVAPDAVPDNLSGREWLFSAAIGAGLATFEGP